MKSIVLLLCLITFAPFAAHAYKHKTEAEIAQMTPAQRVDEWVNESVYHNFRFSDDQGVVLRKYVTADGLKALPRIIEIINEYDPTRFREGKGRRGERFDACYEILFYIDEDAVRLRGSETGRQAVAALERAINRMKAAGYGQPEQEKWAKRGRFNIAVMKLSYAKGVNFIDDAIKQTLRLEYKIIFSESELLELSNFLTAKYPEYPSWSGKNYFQDYTQINEANNPLWIRTMKKPERYYEAYLEFKKRNRKVFA